MITLDKSSFAVVIGVLLHDYSYPIEDIEVRSGYTREAFKEIYNKYKRYNEYQVEANDINIITKGILILLDLLDDNDFYNFIEINKNQSLKFLSLLRAAYKNQKITLITSDLWM